MAQEGDVIKNLSVNSRIVTTLRWIARIWSILIFLFALGVIIVPDPNVVKPVPLTDWIELGFYAVSIVGLLLAWRWEGLGGAITVAGVLGHSVAFRMIRGYWFLGLVVPAFFVAFPGVLFLVCWALPRGERASSPVTFTS